MRRAAVALLLLAACGERAALTAPVRAVRTADCRVAKDVQFADRGVVGTVRLEAHYALCPSDSALAAGGWTRIP